MEELEGRKNFRTFVGDRMWFQKQIEQRDDFYLTFERRVNLLGPREFVAGCKCVRNYFCNQLS